MIKHQRLFALAEVENPALAAKLLKFTLGPDIPAGEAALLLAAIGENHPDLAWAFTMAHIKSPELHLDEPGVSTKRLILFTVVNSTNPLRINELKNYEKNHLPAGSDRNVTNTIYEIRRHSTMALKYSPQAAKWLSHNEVQVD